MTNEAMVNAERILKFSVEYFKHVTSLSIGLIVIFSGLLESLFSAASFKWLAAIAVVSLAFTVFSATQAHSRIIDMLYHVSSNVDARNLSQALAYTDRISTRLRLYTTLTRVGFLLGISLLLAFILINIF